jgi:hypothetical protein
MPSELNTLSFFSTPEEQPTYLEEFLPRPSRFRWFLTGAIFAFLVCGVISVHNFLAVNQPVDHGILVVEGWVPAHTLAGAMDVLNSRKYRQILVVGGPIQNENENDNPNHVASYDQLGTERLKTLGIDTNKLVPVNTAAVRFGRTYTSATAVQHWLDTTKASDCCIDVLTAGPHARKSWVIFRSALGDHYRVGIIAGPEVSYDPRFWFVSTKGIWIVTRNLAGYAYSKSWVFLNGKFQGGISQRAVLRWLPLP